MTKNEVLSQKGQRLHADVGEDIGFEMGAKMIKNYYDKYGEKVCRFVGRNIIEQVLAQPNCIGINIYQALNARDEQTYVCVGVDNLGKAIHEYTVVNDDGSLSKKIGMMTNKFLPPEPGEMWWEWG